jgi:YD repeat-containing protein
VIDAKSAVTTLMLDGSGNVNFVQQPEGINTPYTWGSLQRLASVTDSRGDATSFTYETLAMGRIGGSGTEAAIDAQAKLSAFMYLATVFTQARHP